MNERANPLFGHAPRKRFGQNFLVDQTIIHQIVRAIAPQPTDCMVEIGPGLGALTAPVLQAINHLHVVELDRDLAQRLQQRWGNERLTVHSMDALKFEFSSIVQQPGTLRVIGNLPYNISSPLLFHLFEFAESIKDQHFMLQKEVVERMVATPASKAYGRLSVMLQARYQMENVLDVPPSAFHPPPKVDSAIVRMVPYPIEQIAVKEWPMFAQVVTQAFSQRRKMLRNTLAPLLEKFPTLDVATLGIHLQDRAEVISVTQYIQLANACTALKE